MDLKKTTVPSHYAMTTRLKMLRNFGDGVKIHDEVAHQISHFNGSIHTTAKH
jgi:hypothetical protein